MNEWITQFDAMPGAAAAVDVRAAAFPNDDWFFDAVGRGGRSDSGVTVSPMSALGHGPVWQAVNILAGDVGQLPFRKMKRRRRTGSAGAAQWETEKDDMHWCDFLLRDSPNHWMTPSQWKETMMAWALLWGNAICVIEYRRSDAAHFVPLAPSSLSYEHLDDGNYVIFGKRQTDGKEVQVDYRDCFHIRGLATDGFWGLSMVAVAKNVIGHGIALQRHGDSVFKNAARPSGYLRKPEGALSPEARANLRKEWDAIHAGSHNAGRIAVLWEGMEFHPMSMSNEDAQWLEGRKLDREFIASLFNLPAFKLNALENSAVRANLEEQNRDYFNTSLSRWTNKFAEEASRKLLNDKERRSGQHFFKWFPEAFLKADTRTRYEAYGLAVANRWMSPNEIRQLEDMNPYDGGDEYTNPNIDLANGQPAAEGQVDVRATMDAYGIGVRAGALTPTSVDEDYFRQLANLPPANEAVAEAWMEDNGFRRPITLRDASVAGGPQVAPPANPDEAASAAAAMIATQVRALLNCEAKQLQQEAASCRNFTGWAARYYQDHAERVRPFLEPTCAFAQLMLPQVGWQAAYKQHAETTLAELLDLLSIVTKAELEQSVAEFAKSLPAKADGLTQRILKNGQ